MGWVIGVLVIYIVSVVQTGAGWVSFVDWYGLGLADTGD